MILSLDIGTSSVRAAAFDADAHLIPRTSIKIERTLTSTADGGSEIGADEAVTQVAAAIDAVLEKTKKLKAEIEFVASCSFWHSLVGVDANGKPTTKVLGWADTRSRLYSATLKKRFDESVVHDRTGAHFHSSFWPAKLLWLRKDFPELFAKTDKWLSLGDYIALKLFGEAVTSVSMASGTGIFDQRKCTWDAEMIRYLKLDTARLPKIAERDSDTFSLNKKFKNRWPQLANAKWFPSIADGAADNIGSGCVTKNKAALMVGTSGAMRVAYAGEPPTNIPDGLWCYRIDRERVIIGGALSDGGGLYSWLKKNLKLPKDAEDQIFKRRTGSHGPTFQPFLAGERSTGYAESVKGSITGLTASTDAVDILKAALESVAIRFAEIFDRLNSIVKVKEIVASGGALRDSAVWGQIIADVLDRELIINRVHESSLRGSVLLALESVGTIENIEKLQGASETFIAADKAAHAGYRALRNAHRKIYAAIKNTNL